MWRYLPFPHPEQEDDCCKDIAHKAIVISGSEHLEVTPTDVRDDAPRLQVQQELSDLRPGFVAAVVEIGSDLVVDAVHVISLELAGSLLHHEQWSVSIIPACLREGKDVFPENHTCLL